MDILKKIVDNKRQEIEILKKLSTIQKFRNESIFWHEDNRSLKQNLLAPGCTGIIAEFKRKSPSKGWFKSKDLKVKPVVSAYNEFGAAGISVLTDGQFFGGDLIDLAQARQATSVPILRKDFIIDEWQLAEAKANGADVILLIAACLSHSEVKQMSGFAKSIGLEVLLEIHNEDELLHICDEVDMVGVNNRNLKTFEVDINTSLRLIESIPASTPAISESGISNVETIRTLREAGFKGFLVGENFMKEDDPGMAFADFTERLRGLNGKV